MKRQLVGRMFGLSSLESAVQLAVLGSCTIARIVGTYLILLPLSALASLGPSVERVPPRGGGVAALRTYHGYYGGGDRGTQSPAVQMLATT